MAKKGKAETGDNKLANQKQQVEANGSTNLNKRTFGEGSLLTNIVASHENFVNKMQLEQVVGDVSNNRDEIWYFWFSSWSHLTKH